MDTISFTVYLTANLITREAVITLNVHGYYALSVSLLTTILCS